MTDAPEKKQGLSCVKLYGQVHKNGYLVVNACQIRGGGFTSVDEAARLIEVSVRKRKQYDKMKKLLARIIHANDSGAPNAEMAEALADGRKLMAKLEQP